MPKRATIKAKQKKAKAKSVLQQRQAQKKPAAQTEYNKCMRCDKEFPSRDSLKKHLKMHSQAMQEIKMLEEGYIPVESKIGLEFKGKNRIIIS